MKQFYQSIPKPVRIILTILLVLTGITLLGVIFGFLIAWLWNHTMTEVFGLPRIHFWHAIGLFVLAKLFFGGISQPSPKKVYVRESAPPTAPTSRERDCEYVDLP